MTTVTKCVECGRPRNLTKQVRRYAGKHIDTDPYCSTQCCRAAHGVCKHSNLPPCDQCEKGTKAA
jgi:hypothetical protein